ncbi:hypothetical protein ACW9HR_19185 [Nocardia gipuzkoensis]
MTATSRQRPSRSVTAATRAAAPVAVPSTLWAAGTETLDPGDRWPEPILSRAVREFSAPGDRVLLIGWPAPASRGELRVIEPDTATAVAAAAVAALGRHSEDHPAPHTGAHEPVDLVVASLLADHLDPGAAAEHLAALAVERLAAAGLLVVLGRCRHSHEGVLIDPAGAVVAAAQAADLLYLQHIIAVPVTGHTITTLPTDTPDSGAGRHVVAHTDVFAFLQPRSDESASPR